MPNGGLQGDGAFPHPEAPLDEKVRRLLSDHKRLEEGNANLREQNARLRDENIRLKQMLSEKVLAEGKE